MIEIAKKQLKQGRHLSPVFYLVVLRGFNWRAIVEGVATALDVIGTCLEMRKMFIIGVAWCIIKMINIWEYFLLLLNKKP